MKTLIGPGLAILLCLGQPAKAQFTISTSGTTPSNIDGMWWNANESGWGISFTQQFNKAFVMIYAYTPGGEPHWFVVPDCTIAGAGCSGAIYTVAGGVPLNHGWRANSLTGQGTFAASFSSVNSGSITFTINGVTATKQIGRYVFATSGAPQPETNQQKTERLVGGTWSVFYTIISTFDERYSFTSIRPSTTISGDWIAAGVDQYGGTVVGTYASRQDFWSVLDPGVLIDAFYTFGFNHLNAIGGCYYQVSPAGSTNLSRCYPMTGTRSPAKLGARRAALTQVEQEDIARQEVEIAHGPPEAPRHGDLEAFRRLRDEVPAR